MYIDGAKLMPCSWTSVRNRIDRSSATRARNIIDAQIEHVYYIVNAQTFIPTLKKILKSK